MGSECHLTSTPVEEGPAAVVSRALEDETPKAVEPLDGHGEFKVVGRAAEKSKLDAHFACAGIEEKDAGTGTLHRLLNRLESWFSNHHHRGCSTTKGRRAPEAMLVVAV
ncbi:hypothetical protein NMY22_g17623 [Coprinellus aureogranulatus]|nr:hypothetical protein NMY22_g17623 [Coprinellus aureogranulatus]